MINSDNSLLDADNLPHIDLPSGIQQMGGNEAAAKEMLEMLIQSLPEFLQEMKAYYAKKDYKNLRSIVHKLYGGTCYCAVPKLQAYSKKLEQSLSNLKNKPDVDVIYQKTIEEIEALILNLAS